MDQGDISNIDPEMDHIINNERDRQRRTLGLISNENFVSKAVRQAMGSCLHDKCSEGQVGRRYYGGTQFIDEMEQLTKDRALKVFGLDKNEWGVNVQAYSGTTANMAVYIALVGHNGRIMGLDLPDGGHLSHGYQSPQRKVSATSLFFESKPYKLNRQTQLIDYDDLERRADDFNPGIIITGASCYPRDLDYVRFREIADRGNTEKQTRCYLLADITQIDGLVAAGLTSNPFKSCHVVTMVTNVLMRGPRSAIIFYRNDLGKDLVKKINDAVDPGLQSCPMNNIIAGVGVALKQALGPEFKEYQQQVLKNSKVLAEELITYGYQLLTGGTDNHMVVIDMRPCKNIDGEKVEKVLEEISIIINRNMIVGDRSALKPGGIRLGTPSLTSRNLTEDHIRKVAEFVHRGIELALAVDGHTQPFNERMDDPEIRTQLNEMRSEVEEFANQFPLP